MPDLANFQIVRSGAQALTVPTWAVSGAFVNPADQTQIVRDFTGANAVSFPQILGNLTNAQQDSFVQHAITDLLFRRFGL